MAIGRRGKRAGGGVNAPSVGGAHIIQAHAPTPGAAPLIHANAGSAPLANIIQAPRATGGGGRWFGAPPTPKDKHTKLSGGHAGDNDAFTPYSVERDRARGGFWVGVRNAKGRLTNTKFVTEGEYDWAIGRGAAGANMNPVNLALWRYHTGWKSDEQKKAELLQSQQDAKQNLLEQAHQNRMEEIALRGSSDAKSRKVKEEVAALTGQGDMSVSAISSENAETDKLREQLNTALTDSKISEVNGGKSWSLLIDQHLPSANYDENNIPSGENSGNDIMSVFKNIVSAENGNPSGVAERIVGMRAEGDSIFGLNQEGGTANDSDDDLDNDWI